MIAVPYFNIATFPHGGAQRALDRVKRAAMHGAMGGKGQTHGAMGTEAGTESGPSEPSRLATSNTFWMQLNEASGTRHDVGPDEFAFSAFGGDGGPSHGAGVGGVGNAVEFLSAKSQYLKSATGGLGFDLNSPAWGSCSITFWFYAYSHGTNNPTGLITVPRRGLASYNPSNDHYGWGWSGYIFGNPGADIGSGLSLNTWYNVCGSYDFATNTYRCWRNGVLIQTTNDSFFGPNGPGVLWMIIGGGDFFDYDSFFNGRMSAFGMFKGFAMETAHAQWFYNNGAAARSFAELPNAPF